MKNAARIAACAGGLVLIVVIGSQRFASPLRIAANASFALPGVIAPLIVYVSLRTATLSKNEG